MTERHTEPYPRILTDHGLAERFRPYRRSITLSELFWSPRLLRIPGSIVIFELLWGLKCWLVSFRYPRHIPIITVGHGHGFVFAVLQYLLRWLIKPRTHLMFDLLLNAKGRGLAGVYDSMKARVFNKVVALAVVWGETDVETFAAEHGLAIEKLRFHPHHITLEEYQIDIKDDGFIFAGGNGGRDYTTLIEAVRSLNYPVFIATTLKDVPPMAAPYDHITVQGVSHEEFRRKMAACTIFVEAHDPQFFRTAGHQTFLNAMWMGKPVVMADKRSAVGYFDEGTDGVIVEAGDAEAFGREIKRLLDNPAEATEIGRRAAEKLHDPAYRTLNCMQSIYNLAIELACRREGLDPEDRYIKMY